MLPPARRGRVGSLLCPGGVDLAPERLGVLPGLSGGGLRRVGPTGVRHHHTNSEVASVHSVDFLRSWRPGVGEGGRRAVVDEEARVGRGFLEKNHHAKSPWRKRAGPKLGESLGVV